MKDFLVNLYNDKSLESRLRLTAQLSNKFNAQVCGVYVRQVSAYQTYSPNTLPDAVSEFDQEEKRLLTESRSHLQHYTRLFNNAPDFKEVAGQVSQKLTHMAGAYDLIITGQNETTDWTEPDNVPANIVLGCGRPVLVVPVMPEDATIGESILVAWNGTRESTRALHDAMPMLKKAGYVNVVVFSAPNQPELVVDISDLLTHYEVTHDISHVAATDSAIPQKLTEFISHFDSDLLVMGAYGHSRMREFVLGGVTKSMLNDSIIPVFVSH